MTETIDRSGCPAGPDGEHGTRTSYYRYVQACRCPDAREAVRIYRKRLRYGVADARRKMPVIGAQRRLQALHAIGWRIPDFVERGIGERAHVAEILAGKRTVLLRETHEKIARMFDELQHTAGPSERVRRLARRRGLVDPAGWDGIDIDDPAAVPDVVTPTRSRAIDLDRVEELRGWGLDLEFIARELGVKPVSIRQAVWLQRVRNEKESTRDLHEELELVR